MKKSIPTPDVTLFIYKGMERPGGIQSIVIRNTTFLQNAGKDVFVVCDTSNPVLGISENKAVDINQSPDKIVNTIAISGKRQDYIWRLIALSPDAAPVAFLVQRYLRRKFDKIDARICLCILYPRDLMREQERKHVHLLNKLMAFSINTNNIVFMNDVCRKSHEKFLGQDLSKNPVVPVPIDRRDKKWSPREIQNSIKIVAIGRIVPFKGYNFALPEIVRKLRSIGITVSCDIYGYGTHEAELQQLIKDNDVKYLINFRGPIDLESIDGTICNYDLFIGMGTVALQASQVGVPTILSIVDDPNGTYGYLYEAPFGNVGEEDSSILRKTLYDMIIEYIRSSRFERLYISNKCAMAANKYVMDDYVEKLTAHPATQDGLFGWVSEIYCKFYLWMARDNRIRRSIRLIKYIMDHLRTKLPGYARKK